MAGPMMITVGIRVRWWVRPLLATCMVLGPLLIPLPRHEAFVTRVGGLIARHGIRVEVRL